jgi:hypothetical protein
VRVPTVHINGTSGDDLVAQVRGAGEALWSALAAMQEASPNGRDYYPQGDGALTEAGAEYADRVNRVYSVWQEYQEILEALSDSLDS